MRDDREVVHIPYLVAGVQLVGIQLGQDMAEAPGHDGIVAALDVAVFLVQVADSVRDSAGKARFLGNE